MADRVRCSAVRLALNDRSMERAAGSLHALRVTHRRAFIPWGCPLPTQRGRLLA